MLNHDSEIQKAAGNEVKHSKAYISSKKICTVKNLITSCKIENENTFYRERRKGYE